MKPSNDDAPELRLGIASCKKKSSKSAEVCEVDQKAFLKNVYLETVEMWGSKWHKFEDSRGWVWTQEEQSK